MEPQPLEQQQEQIDHNMTNHPPTPEAIKSIEELRGTAKELGYAIAKLCPGSREKSLAQTNLEQALMWAVASIARQK